MPGQLTKVLIVSDIHYAGPRERERGSYELQVVSQPLLKLLTRFYRRYFWMRDPFAHNHLVQRVLAHPEEVEWVVGNGDFSCDSAFIGVSDEAAFESARECLGLLTGRFGARFRATVGDHELGKTSLFGGRGGMRLKSWELLQAGLGIAPFWHFTEGRYTIVGITSTLIALPTYLKETLPEELEAWQELRETHLAAIRDLFHSLDSRQKLILFAHDPTALPYLAKDPQIARRIPQIERTVIGHLHSESVLWRSQNLAGMPHLKFLGNAVNRMSAALNEARHWRQFKLLLCPALAGIEWRKDGGYYIMELDPSGMVPARFNFHPVPRTPAGTA